MERRDIVPPGLEAIPKRFHYSPGVRVGPLLYVAGQVGRDANLEVVVGKERQIVQAFENVKQVLDEAGARFEDVVDLTTYHTDMRDLPLFMTVKDRYLGSRPPLPAWTGLGVTALSMPGLEVEIKCVALLGS